MRTEPLTPEARLTECLWANPLVRTVFDRWHQVALPGSWIGAGCIAQSIWNARTGQPLHAHIRDIDIVYFDSADLSAEAEAAHEQRLRTVFADLAIPLDVKNQARVHLWYPQRFGRVIAPYSTVEEAVRTWPTPATSIVVRPSGANRGSAAADSKALEVYAPFGLNDLLAGIVRPNKALIDASVYESKVQRWRTCWPGLDFWPW